MAIQVQSIDLPASLPIHWHLPGTLFLGDFHHIAAFEDLIPSSIGSIDYYRFGDRDTILFDREGRRLKAAMLEFGDPLIQSIPFSPDRNLEIQDLCYLADENLILKWSDQAFYDPQQDLLQGVLSTSKDPGRSQTIRLAEDFFVQYAPGGDKSGKDAPGGDEPGKDESREDQPGRDEPGGGRVVGWFLHKSSSYLTTGAQNAPGHAPTTLLHRYLALIQPPVLEAMEDGLPQMKKELTDFEAALKNASHPAAESMLALVQHLLDFHYA